MKDHMEVDLFDEKVKVKMTFGLLHELAALVGDVERVPELAYVAELRESALVTIFSERDDEGEIVEKFKVAKMDTPPAQVVEVLDWAAEHVADFLLSSLTRAHRIVKDRQPELEALTSSSNGGAA